jgi:hypothetical protein
MANNTHDIVVPNESHILEVFNPEANEVVKIKMESTLKTIADQLKEEKMSAAQILDILQKN